MWRTALAVLMEKIGTPTGGCLSLSMEAGITRPSLENTVYERAICSKLADRP